MTRAPGFLLTLTAMLAFWSPVAAQAQQADPASLWADFNHYVLIARYELARDAGQALLDEVDNAELLAIVEASDYADYLPTIVRARRNETVAPIATELEQRIQQARIERSRDPQRIANDIDQLDRGLRRFENAVQRLSAAGQYAAPQLLEALQDDDRSAMHPFVMKAMVAVGQPLVQPLSVALSEVDAVAQTQVAQVLANIGYPQALPYLKRALENPDTDPDAAQVIEAAYERLLAVANISRSASAAELFVRLGREQYNAQTRGQELPGYDPATDKGIVWYYEGAAGLVPVPVPAEVFGDVLAMRSARSALELSPNLDPALSLHLTANLRRENNLPADEPDPTYPPEMKPASFYAMIAGPVRLHDVLSQALDDADSELALDAIEALAQTSGTDALISKGAGRQPLLRALSYPDRTVRFRAAVALANARPRQAFEGAERVVPVLGESIRRSGVRYMLVLADDRDTLNQLLATGDDLGYETFGGLSLSEVMDEVAARPAVDMMLVHKPAFKVDQLVAQTTGDYRLGAVPVLALVSGPEQIRLNTDYGDNPRIRVALATTDPAELREPVQQATDRYRGDATTGEASARFSLTALDLLRELAASSPIYNVVNALPAVLEALDDPRQDIRIAAGRVLELVNRPDAQSALADAALGSSGQVQVVLLGSLAESATYHGNLIESAQTDRLMELVRTGEGETAIAAARAHGALTLPTSNAVELILE